MELREPLRRQMRPAPLLRSSLRVARRRPSEAKMAGLPHDVVAPRVGALVRTPRIEPATVATATAAPLAEGERAVGRVTVGGRRGARANTSPVAVACVARQASCSPRPP